MAGSRIGVVAAELPAVETTAQPLVAESAESVLTTWEGDVVDDQDSRQGLPDKVGVSGSTPIKSGALSDATWGIVGMSGLSWGDPGLTVSAKLTLDNLLDRRDWDFGVSGSCTGIGPDPPSSCLVRPMVSSIPSISDSKSSSSSCLCWRPLVMRKTPKNVRRHPPTNAAACLGVVFSKSR